MSDEKEFLDYYIEKAKLLHHKGDFKGSYKLYKKLSESDVGIGNCMMAIFHNCQNYSFIFKKSEIYNPKLAHEYVQKAIEQDVPRAYNIMGNYFYQKNDYENAYKYYFIAQQKGEIIAQLNIANMYISGEFLKKNVEKGLSMMLELAKINDTSSLIKLGKLYFYGDNVEKNEQTAKEYLIKATESQYQLITIQNW
jgi:TPR repeat protein